jgi:heavy metal efflux system protein
MLSSLVAASVRFRGMVLVLLGLLFAAGGWAASTLPVDAIPDVSSVQVSVLTKAPGLSPVEVERTVTVPIENGLNGVPGVVESRSISRSGLSAVTLVFRDGADVWLARALVLERLRGVQAELPAGAETPELAPVSTGLGEIYQFTVKSDLHSPTQLRTLLDWHIVPRLRGVPGVIEVNTMGGDLKQFHVLVERGRLRAHHLTLQSVIDALRSANMNTGGGYVERNAESYTLRGEGMLLDEREIGNVVVRTEQGAAPVLIKHVADVRVGAALRYGVIIHDGKGEAVTGVVMMLLGENSREVVHSVAARVEEIRTELPPGVELEVIYDRADFVGQTLSTVVHNLVEGVVVVSLVLWVFLGTLRGSLAVVLGVPASMSVALLGMHLFGITGDLMSLGAIDFGFLVDGPIVVLEAIMASAVGARLTASERAPLYARLAQGVMRPVAFAVAITMLVYIPLLGLQGIEGKMFRPMAVTMACALFGALIYAVVFFPAVAVALVPAGGHGPRWIAWVTDRYAAVLPAAIRLRYPLVAASAAALVAVGSLFAQAGADFVPRIFEGDAVVAIRRAPSVSLTMAGEYDLAAERVLATFPEVKTTLAMTGRAEVAVDPVGNDNTDMLVRLQPRDTWTTADDFDELSEIIKDRIESQVPGTFVSVSQPIEDRTNELISGSRADVAIRIVGKDLLQLAQLADDVGERIKRIPGSGDVRVERILGQPMISMKADRERMARYGVTVSDAFLVLQAAREGVKVGEVYEGQQRFDLRVLQTPAEPTAAALGEMFVESTAGGLVPLREVMRLSESDGPSAVRRQERERTVRVDVNLRGRDLVSWVSEAKAMVERDLPLPPGYRITFGGQFENFERAQRRLAVLVPMSVAIIFAMLFAMFRELRLTLAVMLTVPFALTGGMAGLLLRGLSFSLPAAVGFIALGGVAVLNGVVIGNRVKTLLDEGEPLDRALLDGAAHTARAVLATSAVAALGFLPMALSTTAGAEVQRPLATVVIFGILCGTVVTLLVLPGMLSVALRNYAPATIIDAPPAPPSSRG